MLMNQAITGRKLQNTGIPPKKQHENLFVAIVWLLIYRQE